MRARYHWRDGREALAGVVAADEPEKKDKEKGPTAADELQRFQGTWTVEAWEEGGKPLAEGDLKTRGVFFGANVFPETISLGLEQPEVRAHVTGKFVMEVKEGLAEKPRLAIAVELAAGAAPEDALAQAAATAILAQLRRLNSEFANYVPAEFQTPLVTLYPQGHPDHFPVGVKHRYSRK